MDENQRLENLLVEIDKLKEPIKTIQGEIDRIKFEGLKNGTITEDQDGRLKILEKELKIEQGKLKKFLEKNVDDKKKLDEMLEKEFKEFETKSISFTKKPKYIEMKKQLQLAKASLETNRKHHEEFTMKLIESERLLKELEQTNLMQKAGRISRFLTTVNIPFNRDTKKKNIENDIKFAKSKLDELENIISAKYFLLKELEESIAQKRAPIEEIADQRYGDIGVRKKHEPYETEEIRQRKNEIRKLQQEIESLNEEKDKARNDNEVGSILNQISIRELVISIHQRTLEKIYKTASKLEVDKIILYELKNSAGVIKSSLGQGSCFIAGINEEGVWVITNTHVVEKDKKVQIYFDFDGSSKSLEAKVVYANKITDDQDRKTYEEPDIALVQIPASSFEEGELASMKPLMLHPILPGIGEKLYIVGNPESTTISGLNEIKTLPGTWLGLSGVIGTVVDINSTHAFETEVPIPGRTIAETKIRENKTFFVYNIESNKFIKHTGGTVFSGNSGSAAVQLVNDILVVIGMEARGNDDINYIVPTQYIIDMLKMLEETQGIIVPYTVYNPNQNINLNDLSQQDIQRSRSNSASDGS